MNSVISEMPGPRGGGEGARAVPARADHDADRGELVLGLDDGELVLAGVRIDAELLAVVLMKASASDDDGVIGYQAQTVAPP